MSLWPWRRQAAASSLSKPVGEPEPSPRVNGPAFVVVKVGGSLFDLPDLAERLKAVRDRRPRQLIAFIPGGGKTADAVREYQAIHRLSDEAAHRAALQTMDVNATLLTAIWERVLPPEKIWTDFDLKFIRERLAPPAVCVWNPVLLSLKQSMRQAFNRLPATWDVTSDSIAATVAVHLPAAELILLKSRPAPQPATRSEAVRDGGVDPRFAEIARPILRVTWIDLRTNPTHETVLE